MNGKTRGLTGVICAGVLTAMFLVSNAVAQYSGGRGTALSPYRLGSHDDWKELVLTEAHWDRHFALIADIDFSGMAILQIAPDTGADISFEGTPFTGVLDGRGFVVRNGRINRPGHSYVGLFGFIGPGGEVRNLGVEAMEVTGDYYVGGLAGANRGTLRSCHFYGTVTGHRSSVGGMVGDDRGGTISKCHAYAAVSGDWLIGGLAGGGLESAISDSYARGMVVGDSYVGGLAGYLNTSTVQRSYAAVVVTGSVSPGGLVGGGWNHTVDRCYWDTMVSGLAVSSGGEGRGTVEMTWPHEENTFVGWDFGRVWAYDRDYAINGGYPWLPLDEDGCGCCRALEKEQSLKQAVERFRGDWLLFGLALLALAAGSGLRP